MSCSFSLFNKVNLRPETNYLYAYINNIFLCLIISRKTLKDRKKCPRASKVPLLCPMKLYSWLPKIDADKITISLLLPVLATLSGIMQKDTKKYPDGGAALPYNINEIVSLKILSF